MEAWLEFVGSARWLVPAVAALRIVLILVVAWALILLAQKLVRAARLRIAARLHGDGAAKRAETSDARSAIWWRS